MSADILFSTFWNLIQHYLKKGFSPYLVVIYFSEIFSTFQIKQICIGFVKGTFDF